MQRKWWLIEKESDKNENDDYSYIENDHINSNKRIVIVNIKNLIIITKLFIHLIK